MGGTLQVDRGGFRHRGAVGVVVGLLALGAAIWLITSHRADFRSAVDSIRRASPGLIAAAIVLPALNWFSTTATFWILTRRVGKVGFVEMGALMGSAWLANYLPLKPGLVARIAYHATCNGIHPVASAKVVLQAVVLSALAASSLIVIALSAGLAETASIHNGILLGAAIALACLLAYAVRFSMGLIKLPADNPAGLVPAMIAAFAFRGLDALTWVFRYLVAFELVGAPIGLANATALAAVSQAVAALPLVGSVLGVREWVVGTLSSFLPDRTARIVVESAATARISIGLLADLVNRVIEVVWAVMAGVVCSAWLARRIAAGVRSPGDALGPQGTHGTGVRS